MSPAPFPLAAYLERVGAGPDPSLAALHRAHAAAIPFENLDPRRGVPVSLEPAELAAKLVARRRGGYCFEHNLLLGAALQALGFRVELMLGRVRFGRPPGRISPRSHLALRVEAHGGAWLADAGFGTATLLEPLPFGPGDIHEQSGWRYRVIADGDEHVLQAELDGAWTDLYGFEPRPAPRVDLETSNWFTATHPRSPFVTGLIVATRRPDGTRLELCDWQGPLELTESTPSGRTVTAVELEEVPRLLEAEFGLAGFGLDEAGALVPV